MRKFDWKSTSLGPPDRWPQSLKTAVRILLTSRQPMFIWWGDSLINLYNDPYRSILGGKHPAALGQPASVVWQEIWDQVGPRAHSAIASNQGTYDEALFLMMERNGYPEETYYTFSYSPIPNDQGETFGIFCANTDETQRIISTRRLATQRELAARTTDALTVADACASGMAALATNPYDLPFALLYLKQPGNPAAELMGRSGVLLDPGAPFQEAAFWPLDKALRSAKPSLMDLPGGIHFPAGAWDKPPDRAVLLPINTAGQIGSSAVLIVGLNPHRAYDDSYDGFLTLIAGQIASALTSAGAYQQERRRAEALEDLDRAKTTFFSNISHEFRTPLTLMLGPVEDLLARYAGSASTSDRESLVIIHRNAVRLQKLVNALLDFSRIEAGRMSAHFQPTDLPAFTCELASAFQSAMERAKLVFTVDCKPFSQPVLIDREMWEKIVLNLLSNALKYTFEGAVSLHLEQSAGSALLTVSDTGTGIPQTELPRLFERFHRVAGARGRTFEGTGIGLALVQELVRLHDGTVGVTSSVDKGSAFTVSLPLRPANLSQNPALEHQHSLQAETYIEEALGWLPQSSDALASSQPRQLGTKVTEGRILLVDDNADMRAYVERLLSSNYDVVVASNGSQALNMALADPPDLVLSDIMMPELDGFGLLRELRANPVTKSVPVVFLSARAGEEASAEGREAGADDYIVKPFTARELLARVRGTLLIHRERRHAIDQLNQIFEQAPVAICVFNKQDFVFELANPFYHQLVRGRQLVGRKLAEALPELPEAVWQAFRQVVDLGQPFQANEWYIPYDADGDGEVEDHWFNVNYNPLRNSDQSIRGLISVSYDITRQVQSRKEVERVNRELEEFAYVASHDLQEPLRMVNIYSQMLIKKQQNLTPDSLKYVEFIGAGVRRMEELIRDLLSFARNVQSEALTLEPVSLRICLDKALATLQVQIDEKSARLEIGELPRVMGEETQLPQLFQNLLSNALKYSKADTAPVLQIESRRHNKEWVISVRDNGIGFKQEYERHIFGLFKRLHRNEYAGTGLGLAICKRIVERLGGRIWAESELGAGSTFFFTLTAAD
jgi:PAS domain S-box-containing protein